MAYTMGNIGLVYQKMATDVNYLEQRPSIGINKKGNLERSLEFYGARLEIAKEIKDNKLMSEILEGLSKTCEELGEHRSSLKYYKEHI